MQQNKAKILANYTDTGKEEEKNTLQLAIDVRLIKIIRRLCQSVKMGQDCEYLLQLQLCNFFTTQWHNLIVVNWPVVLCFVLSMAQ